MQTKQQIQQLLTSAGAKVIKRLGQHFLIDLNLMRLLIDSANISDADIVLEVGCGTGSLTEGLAEHAGYCLAVEYDRILTEIAKNQLTKARNVKIINADILKNKNAISPLVLNELASARKNYTGRFLLVANLPYNVASPVMLNLATGPMVADSMCVTVQKQVADRMAAGPGSKDYGILSILLCATGDIKLLRVLKPTVFWPQPKVESAIVRFVRDKEKVRRIKDMKLFKEIVELFMGHRRKTLIGCSKLATRRPSGGRSPKDNLSVSSLSGVALAKTDVFSVAKITNWQDIFNSASIDPHKRGEQLSPEEYIAIANLCDEILR
jgi:16S rRNA (adenine1518-N6/adenine1519-N6)-dimethyltransferase